MGHGCKHIRYLVLVDVSYTWNCIFTLHLCTFLFVSRQLALTHKYISDTVLFNSECVPVVGFLIFQNLSNFLFDQGHLKNFFRCVHICHPVLCTSSATHCSGSCSTMKLFTWYMPSKCLLSVYEWDYSGNKTGKMNLCVIIFHNPGIVAHLHQKTR
jgi:hypothetical protein